MESTAFNIITFKTHPNPDQPPDHPLPSLPCTFLPTSGCSAPQCGPFSSWDFSRDLADVKPCISTKCSSVFADSVCWPSWRSGWDSFEWRVAKRRKTKWLTSNYSWKDDQAPLRKCSLAFLHAQMAVLPDSSQGLGCSEPLRKLFLVNQNGCPKNKLSHDNFESCSQTLQIKAVWEMVQISMQTWGCLSETNLQNLASSEKNEQCWVGSLHAAWWKARQPCRWCLTCSQHGRPLGSPSPSWPRNSLQLDLAGWQRGGGYGWWVREGFASSALPSDWGVWERSGESSEERWGWATGSGCRLLCEYLWEEKPSWFPGEEKAYRCLFFLSWKYSHGPWHRGSLSAWWDLFAIGEIRRGEGVRCWRKAGRRALWGQELRGICSQSHSVLWVWTLARGT